MKHTSIDSWLKVVHFVFWVRVDQTKHLIIIGKKVLKGCARHLSKPSDFIQITTKHLIMSTQKTLCRTSKELSIDAPLDQVSV